MTTRPASDVPVTPELLLADFNYWRELTKHTHDKRQRGDFVAQIAAKTTKGEDRLAMFGRMAAWCRESGYEPRYWLYCLFVQRRWLFPVGLNQLVPKDPRRAIRCYQENTDVSAWARRLREERHNRATSEGRAFDPNRDTTGTTESLKRRYRALGMVDQCMAKIREETMGFHPKSEVCTECPLRQACEAATRQLYGFDSTAYRNGQMTDRQAQELAAMARSRK